jgi:phage gp45-like
MRALNKIYRLIRNIVHRGVVVRTRYENGVLVVQFTGTGGAPFDAVEHVQNYGFSSRPLPDAEVVALSLAGNGSHTIIVATGDRRYLLEVGEGDAALYDYRGNFAWIKGDLMHVKHTTKIKLETPDVDVVGRLNVAGDANFGAKVSANGKRIDDTHNHPAGTPPGNTGAVN